LALCTDADPWAQYQGCSAKLPLLAFSKARLQRIWKELTMKKRTIMTNCHNPPALGAHGLGPALLTRVHHVTFVRTARSPDGYGNFMAITLVSIT
jgi:hypothetical protein